MNELTNLFSFQIPDETENMLMFPDIIFDSAHLAMCRPVVFIKLAPSPNKPRFKP